jgi:hypothetical protein
MNARHSLWDEAFKEAEIKQPSLDRSSYETRPRRSRPDLFDGVSGFS